MNKQPTIRLKHEPIRKLFSKLPAILEGKGSTHYVAMRPIWAIFIMSSTINTYWNQITITEVTTKIKPYTLEYLGCSINNDSMRIFSELQHLTTTIWHKRRSSSSSCGYDTSWNCRFWKMQEAEESRNPRFIKTINHVTQKLSQTEKLYLRCQIFTQGSDGRNNLSIVVGSSRGCDFYQL